MVAVGQVISGKYKLLRLLGDGGMGSVYEAEHLVLGTHVAIKVLHGDLARRPGLIERFLQEARVSAQIRSPHVVHVTDTDRTPDGIAYLVMELLQGEPLASVQKRERTLGVGTACEYTLQILQALEAAHALGVIHRDLKPDNVFVTFEGGRPVLKLIDFGIAKLKRVEGATGGKNLTVAGMLMGTPEYMAPEQVYAADKVDVRADLYAVGVMLYEMLSGQPPASGDDPRVVALKVERGEVTPLVHVAPNVPPELAGFVHRAMAPRPELRFATATEMRLALEAVMQGKRAPGTAKLVASEPPAAPVRVEMGTGTVMGAPVAHAVAPPARPVGVSDPAMGSTVRAAPIDASILRAAPYPSAPLPSPMPIPGSMVMPAPSRSLHDERSPARRRGGSGTIVALAILALLLGAGAVVAYVLGTESTHTIPDIATTVTPTSTSTAPATTTPNAPAAVTTTPPLTPPPRTAEPQATQPRPRPSASTAPSPAPSGAPSSQPPPPFVLPSGFPSGFPSAIPLPSAFPLPSGFPTIQWPPPAPPGNP